MFTTFLHLTSGLFSQILGLINSIVFMNPGSYPNGYQYLWINVILFIVGSIPIVPILILELIFRLRAYYQSKTLYTIKQSYFNFIV